MNREELVERMVEVLRADGRVCAAWLAGSLGRGVGDRYSDVDVVVAVNDVDRKSFVADWDRTAASIARLC
jgi:predicted nucleotidyltransferase